MKKIITIATLSILSAFAQAEVQTQTPQEPIYKTTDVEKVSDLVKGQWNYLKIEDDSTVGKISAKLQDSDNKENVAIILSKLKNNKVGIEYPIIAIATEKKEICKTCDVKVSFDNKTYQNFKIQEIDKNEYKVGNTGLFYKKFSEAKEVYIEIPKLGKYQYKFADLNFDMPKTSWLQFDVMIPDLQVPVKVATLEENNAGGTLSIYTPEDDKKMVGILLNDTYQCKANACTLNMSFDNVKKTFTAFQFQNELMIDDSKEFLKLLDKSKTLKVSIKGSKNKQSYIFDNSIKDYQ